eukprot:GFKZ01011913.1.p1 GENE.GFKZ01011913.1~~GFKZ01011913.1.p1  ORF type:complete len:528 (+),score=57.19 GFKZ01011913.1:219-1802(+)
MATEPAPPSSQVLLEDLFDIPDEGYTTGSERIDGLIIGLATLLLIRNAEFVVIDLLTPVFGNRKHKVAFRVLRTWQMLNIVSIFSLLSGFDSDLPRSRFTSRSRFSSLLSCCTQGKRYSSLRVNRGNFAPYLFLAVLCGKIFVLLAEVAIIAFVIPSERFHRSRGGLTLALTESVISERDFHNFGTCHAMLNSTFLSDFAQLTLCRRFFTGRSLQPVPQNWLPDEKIRIERTAISPLSMSETGATIRMNGRESLLTCRERDAANSSTRRYVKEFREVSHQVSISDVPDVELINDVNIGELAISGSASMLMANGRFQSATVGVTPIFNDRRKMLRLSFQDWADIRFSNSSEPVWTLNGKLLFGSISRLIGKDTFTICPDAVDEIIRVTGTLDAGMILDTFILSTKVKTSTNFSEPATDISENTRSQGFDIGVSKKYPLSPIWIIIASIVAVLLSGITSALNRTEAIMARTYREQNEMNGASSPIFLSDESHKEAMLFQHGEKYHWGKNPGEEWREVQEIESPANAVLT